MATRTVLTHEERLSRLPQRRLQVADLALLPDEAGTRYELIQGVLHVTMQPHWQHQTITAHLVVALGVWSMQTGRGVVLPTPGVILAPDEAVVPDVVWVRRERLPGLLGEDGKVHGAPDLVIEVLSPGRQNQERDRVAKRDLYQRHGVVEYWIVDRWQRGVEVYRLAEGPTVGPVAVVGEGDDLTSPLLPGFSVAVAALFAV
jgi:Uma2 family endonuclease